MTATLQHPLLQRAATELAPWLREKGEVVGRRLRTHEPMTTNKTLRMWTEPFVVGVRRGLSPAPASGVSGLAFDQAKSTAKKILAMMVNIAKWTLAGVAAAIFGIGFLLGRASKRSYVR